MWKTKTLISSSMFIALLGACGGSTNKTAEPAPPAESTTSTAPAQETPMAGTPESGMTCPFADSGVEVAVEDVEGGAALTFTTDTANGGTAEQVEFLREWAEERAVQSNGHMGMQGMGPHGHDMHGQGMSGEMPDQQMPDQHAPMPSDGTVMMIPPAEATATDVPDGVVLTIRAKRPEDVSELREQVNDHAEMIREGNCPMMQAAPMEEDAMPLTPMEQDPMAPDPMAPTTMGEDPTMEEEPMMEEDPTMADPMAPTETTP